MKINTLRALLNLYNNPIREVASHYKSTNRINGVGEALEYYVKDIYCDSINEKDTVKKDKIHRIFSPIWVIKIIHRI